MKSLFSLFLFVTASLGFATPVAFNKDFLDGKDERLSTVLHFKADETTKKLRFLLFVPKLAKAAEVKEFASKTNNVEKKHDFFKVADDEVFTEFLGLSDCTDWFASVVTVWKNEDLVHRFLTGYKEGGRFVHDTFRSVETVLLFLRGKTTREHFAKLVPAGLPAHFFTHTFVFVLKKLMAEDAARAQAAQPPATTD